MRTYKTEKRQVQDTVHCDICDYNCTDKDFGSEYATLEASWGYISDKDGVKYDIQLCELWFDKTIKWMKKERQKILGCFIYPHADPFDGY